MWYRTLTTVITQPDGHLVVCTFSFNYPLVLLHEYEADECMRCLLAKKSAANPTRVAHSLVWYSKSHLFWFSAFQFDQNCECKWLLSFTFIVAKHQEITSEHGWFYDALEECFVNHHNVFPFIFISLHFTIKSPTGYIAFVESGPFFPLFPWLLV